MSGGDVGPLESDAVTEIHKLFQWAQASPRGLMLFIDEAEAFLKKRSYDGGEAQRNALNALLYNTGTASNKFMLVLATNRPEDLDEAVGDRVDEQIEFPLPEIEERKRLLKLYFDVYVTQAKGITVDPQLALSVDGVVEDVAYGTAGFSGRALAKMMISLQAEAYGNKGVVTRELMIDTATWKLQQFKRRAEQYARTEAVVVK